MKHEIHHAETQPKWPRLGVLKGTGEPYIQINEGDKWHCLVDAHIEGLGHIDPLPPGSTVILTQE